MDSVYALIAPHLSTGTNPQNLQPAMSSDRRYTISPNQARQPYVNRTPANSNTTGSFSARLHPGFSSADSLMCLDAYSHFSQQQQARDFSRRTCASLLYRPSGK